MISEDDEMDNTCPNKRAAKEAACAKLLTGSCIQKKCSFHHSIPSKASFEKTKNVLMPTKLNDAAILRNLKATESGCESSQKTIASGTGQK